MEIDKLLHSAIQSKGAHYDLAMIIYYFYQHEYKVVNDKWYKLHESEWIEIDTANDLYINISRKIFDVLMEKHNELFAKSRTAETIEQSDMYKEMARTLYRIATNCKMVNYKNNLIKECKPLFTVGTI